MQTVSSPSAKHGRTGSTSMSGTGGGLAAPLDPLEAALDGIENEDAARRREERSKRRAHIDPELIMLTLRGLPVFPNPPQQSQSPPEAAFTVGGGPPSLVRDVLLPPYPHSDAPTQIYTALDHVRRMHNHGEYRSAVRLANHVLRVWKRKTSWKFLKEHPEASLQEAIEEDDRRMELRRIRAIKREKERRKAAEEEAEFLRRKKEMEGEDEGEGGSAGGETRRPDGETHRSKMSTESDSSDSESESEDEGDMSHDSIDTRGTRESGALVGEGADEDGETASHQSDAADNDDDEIIELPTVSAEEELEFLLFYYNTLGSIYASAASASSAVGGAVVSGIVSGGGAAAGGASTGGTRWGRMRVIAAPAAHPSVTEMLEGTRGYLGALSAQYTHGGSSQQNTGRPSALDRRNSLNSAMGTSRSTDLNTMLVEECFSDDEMGGGEDETDGGIYDRDMDMDSGARSIVEGSSGGSVGYRARELEQQYREAAASAYDEEEEEFLVSSTASLKNNSSARALVALFQALRAHDAYVQHRMTVLKKMEWMSRTMSGGASTSAKAADGDEGEEVGDEEKEGDEDTSSSAAAAGTTGDANDASDLASLTRDQFAPPQDPRHSTAGNPMFSRINVPSMSLEALQAEARALGLFELAKVFGPSTANGGLGGESSNASLAYGASSAPQSTPSSLEEDRQRIETFWSLQPPVFNPNATQGMGGTQRLGTAIGGFHGESQKSLASFGSTSSLPDGSGGASISNMTNGHSTSVVCRLLNPFVLCSPADATTYSNIGLALYQLDNLPLALRCFHVSLRIRLACLNPQEDEFGDVASSLNNIGVVLAAMGCFPEAFEWMTAAKQVVETRFSQVHPRRTLVDQNLAKLKTRRVGLASAESGGSALMQQLRTIAETKEKKEWDARERRLAKLKKSKKQQQQHPPRPPAGKEVEPPKEFHENPKWFKPLAPGETPLVPPKNPDPDAPLPPLGSAAASITRMPLRQWQVAPGDMSRLQKEFGTGAGKKKGAAAGAKGKKK